MMWKNDFKSILVKENISMNELNNLMNEHNNKNNTVENLRQKINNETMKYSEILTIANLIGYEVVWKKKEK
ncbi:hypothetical protein ACWJXL_17755 [Clostridioides difficile]|uniref:hypothetical protein n=1 Tax=Clostridioides difficile TaxID=1496 RepID=UPI0005E7EDF7|nr:hypothetical protein [Clostridioides difficile]KJF62300.1 hypothetical protein TZ54_15995 [Clostridioides difficile]MBG0192850.1 hypothetical protein [Clostridioides difficile]MBG0295428.1 hypothetical protein [Clostridioides difficile]MBH7251753.1 hypothetical protein [Clostridioides difficile]MBH7464026.1 hypothetical protein [Clostridioides difficile]